MKQMLRWTLLGAVLWGLAGAPAAMAQDNEFMRRVAPFPVLQAPGGDAYAMPFLGGLNTPAPQFVDIDGDGDQDLFVQERPGDVMFFENVGTPDAASFEWRTDNYAGLDVGEWFLFDDVDGDGDPDLFAEERFGFIRYYRNEGGAEADFVLAEDTLRAADGQPIVAERQNIPSVTDLECDGMLDLMLGRQDGTLTHYESTGLVDGVPQFAFIEDRFQDIEIIGAGKQGGARHGANAVRFLDQDGDGDPDMFWGDFNESGVLAYENAGDCGTVDVNPGLGSFSFAEPFSSSGFNVPAFADLDGDGDLDLYVGVLGGAFSPFQTLANNFIAFENEGGVYTLQTRRFLDGIDLGDQSKIAFADLDADGDADLLVGNQLNVTLPISADLVYFENVGTAEAPSFAMTETSLFDAVPANFNYAPAFADVDADGDQDLFVGNFTGQIAFFRNEGTAAAPSYTAEATNYVSVSGGYADPAFADLDADGDLDLMVGKSSGEVTYFENQGTAQEPNYVLIDPVYGGIDVGQRSAPAFVDFDFDGDLDLVLGSDEAGLAYYRNDGTAEAPSFVASDAFDLPVPPLAAPAFVDIDGDTNLDFFAGTALGGLVYYENTRSGVATEGAPEVPAAASLLGSYPNPFREAATLRYALPAAAHVRLAVYDVLGREVAVLVDAEQAAGTQEARFAPAGLPSGLYVVRFAVDGRQVQTTTALYVR